MSFKKRAEKSTGPVNLQVGNYHAWIVGLIDVGTHPYEFNGIPGDPKQRLWIVFEIPKQDGNEQGDMVFSHDCVFSFHENSNLREYYENVMGVTLQENEEVDVLQMMGKQVTITIKRTKGGWPTVTSIIGATRGVKIPNRKRKPIAFSIDELRSAQIPMELSWVTHAYGKTLDNALIESEEYQAAFAPKKEGLRNDDTPAF